MKARLSSSDYPKLAELTTREADDPAIALLDAWATVADVLTFYQERIANEGYIRTAIERLSVLELARLVGYQPRPGVASSVYLAYTLDQNLKEETVIPKNTRSQSIPGPGELPQSFETTEDLKARALWNNLRPRMTRPQTEQTILAGDGQNARIYLKGISTDLKPNDPLLIDFTGKDPPKFFRVKEVRPDPKSDRTLVTLQKVSNGAQTTRAIKPINLIGALTLKPSVQPANPLMLERNLGSLFLGSGRNAEKKYAGLTSGEASHAVLKAFSPVLHKTLSTAVENAQVTEINTITVYALRVKASLFGHSHPGTPKYERDKESGMVNVLGYSPPILSSIWPPDMVTKNSSLIAIEPSDEQITRESWVVIERPILKDCNVRDWDASVHEVVEDPRQVTLSAFGISTMVSLLTIKEPWIKVLGEGFEKQIACESLLRKTSVYARSEELELAEEPIDESLCGGTDQLIELDGLYEGLESGRWVIVSGERDIPGTSGVQFSEQAMVQSVDHAINAELNGDKIHTFIRFAEKLQYCFKRENITICGNVVKATHGETRKEFLGSGDGAKALQSFTLKQPPMTYVSASNPSGVDSTLKVFVNDVRWLETDALGGLSPKDRKFITKTDNEGKTTIVFGNGKEGAMLPTGMENIKAEYRNGIGKPGNVKAEQITLLTSRPLGVKEVVNPLPATGGANKERRDQARKNAPLAVMALDRLVSVQDYEDFCRIYAGIGKARALGLSDGRTQIVHITIAGAEDIPIEESSDLYRNLRQALLDFGDPHQTIRLEIRELVLIVISARIRTLDDYQWESVEPMVRAALLDSFSFDRRELGQDVLLSQVISVMQAVPGVAYVDVEVFGGLPERKTEPESGNRELLTPDEIAQFVKKMGLDSEKKKSVPDSRIVVNLAKVGNLLPAQIAFLTPEVPETLILNPII